MNSHFADRLLSAIQEKDAPACVGLDPLAERLPPVLLEEYGIKGSGDTLVVPGAAPSAIVDAILAFSREVIRVVAPHVPAVKVNVAFFERYYADGVRAYFQVVRSAQEAGLMVIGDVKRADIGHSSTQYARAFLGDPDSVTPADISLPDCVTVNPYFGFDGIRPFVDSARDTGRGLFVLVQTSNESAKQIQGLALSDGSLLCQCVSEIVQTWAGAEGLVGDSGYSCVGAVVSPRDLESTKRIRTSMPNCLFLVPGFGAQGRTAEEVAQCFKTDGTGAIVNASRSVIYAYQQEQYQDRFGDDWQRCVKEGAKEFVQAIRAVMP